MDNYKVYFGKDTFVTITAHSLNKIFDSTSDNPSTKYHKTFLEIENSDEIDIYINVSKILYIMPAPEAKIHN